MPILGLSLFYLINHIVVALLTTCRNFIGTTPFSFAVFILCFIVCISVSHFIFACLRFRAIFQFSPLVTYQHLHTYISVIMSMLSMPYDQGV